MDEKIKEIFKKYDCDIVNITKMNDILYEAKLKDDRTVLVKMADDKEKIAWEYKCLLNLNGKVRVPKIFMPNDEYITECIVFEKPIGKLIETFEDKEKIANLIGVMLGNIHILEFNEQRSEEELKKIWNKHILNKTLYIGSAITEIFTKEKCDKVLEYLTESVKTLSEDFELSMIVGNFNNNDIIYNSDNDSITFINFSSAMLGDPSYDFAKIYKYFQMDEGLIKEFISGYEDIISVPTKLDSKINLFLMIDYIEEIIKIKDNKEMKPKVDKYIEMIENIINGAIKPLV